ncbi:uncharacterized protein LOC129004159 [Macrosteles quadrilineatus]|uniref:uncharacterized protein LOC129004159 n=1 Tax=Macrosteles quadrilineatus TaxID=74068 RepID=UPI0023E27556|nr:uncharacterized protein LOC129004159 [Macrosteles quadrilineatus]
MALLELATLLVAVSLTNFSLALITGLLYLPPTLWVNYSSIRWLKKLVWLVYHPLAMLWWVVLASTSVTFPESTGWDLLGRAFSATKHALTLSCVDNLVYGNVIFPIGMVFLLPVWIQIWLVCLSKEEVQEPKKEKTE